MVNNNLVPEKRTDKNGVSSIRWVKPNVDSSSSLAGVPAPAISAQPHQMSAELIEKAATAYIHTIEEDQLDDDEYIADVIEGAEDSFADFPETIISEIAKDSGEGNFLKHWGLKLMIDSPAADHDRILDYLKLSESLHEADYEEPEDAVRMAVSLSTWHSSITPINVDGSYPDERQKQLSALLRATEWVETLSVDGHIPQDSMVEVSIAGHEGIELIADDGLVQLVIERADDIDSIVEFMRTRKSIDLEAIREVIEWEVQPLNGGVL